MHIEIVKSICELNSPFWWESRARTQTTTMPLPPRRTGSSIAPQFRFLPRKPRLSCRNYFIIIFFRFPPLRGLGCACLSRKRPNGESFSVQIAQNKLKNGLFRGEPTSSRWSPSMQRRNLNMSHFSQTHSSSYPQQHEGKDGVSDGTWDLGPHFPAKLISSCRENRSYRQAIMRHILLLKHRRSSPRLPQGLSTLIFGMHKRRVSVPDIRRFLEDNGPHRATIGQIQRAIKRGAEGDPEYRSQRGRPKRAPFQRSYALLCACLCRNVDPSPCFFISGTR